MSFDDSEEQIDIRKRKMPIIKVFPSPVKTSELSPTEQRVYLQLSLEFSLILEEAPSFQMGAYQWNLILPDRLQTFAMTADAWERLSSLGDNNDELQNQLADLVDNYN